LLAKYFSFYGTWPWHVIWNEVVFILSISLHFFFLHLSNNMEQSASMASAKVHRQSCNCNWLFYYILGFAPVYLLMCQRLIWPQLSWVPTFLCLSWLLQRPCRRWLTQKVCMLCHCTLHLCWWTGLRFRKSKHIYIHRIKLKGFDWKYTMILSN